MDQERRQSPRFGVSTPLVVRECSQEHLGEAVGGTLLDFSLMGFSIQSGVRFEPGTRLLVERLTVRGPTLQEAVVRHVRFGDDAWVHGGVWDSPEELAMQGARSLASWRGGSYTGAVGGVHSMGG